MSQILTVERKRIDPHRLYGAVVGESPHLILLHEQVDFLFDGYTVIRRKDIARSFTSESNDYIARIMKKEGRWERVPRWVKKLPLDSWADLLQQFVGKVVILENERTDDFYIGPVMESSSTSVRIHYFDGCGDWGEVERVPFSKITRMKFGDRYSTTHAKYLRKAQLEDDACFLQRIARARESLRAGKGVKLETLPDAPKAPRRRTKR